MKKPIIRNTTTIDAEGQSIGRVASQVAQLLQGKHRTDYVQNVDLGDKVQVTNAAKVKVLGNKAENKYFYAFSGYPGGMKSKQLKTVMATNPAEAIEHAVYSMLPKNRLRKDRMKRLKISN